MRSPNLLAATLGAMGLTSVGLGLDHGPHRPKDLTGVPVVSTIQTILGGVADNCEAVRRSGLGEPRDQRGVNQGSHLQVAPSTPEVEMDLVDKGFAIRQNTPSGPSILITCDSTSSGWSCTSKVVPDCHRHTCGPNQKIFAQKEEVGASQSGYLDGIRAEIVACKGEEARHPHGALDL